MHVEGAAAVKEAEADAAAAIAAVGMTEQEHLWRGRHVLLLRQEGPHQT